MKKLLRLLALTAIVGTTAAVAQVPATPTSLPGAVSFPYREGENEMLLHVFKPQGWKQGDRRPAMIFFFGGGWTRGTPERSAYWAKWAASLGFMGIAPDYRTNERFKTTPLEAVADARAALRWVQANSAALGIDPAKVIVGGSSAGGHLALWTAISTTPPGSSPNEAPLQKPAGLILLSAVSDTSMLSGYTPRRFGDNATPLSPLHQMDEKMPPVLAFHGDADPTVPYSQAVALHEKLLATGNQSELVTVPGGNHGFTSQFPEWREKSREHVRKFLGTLNLTKKSR